MSSQGLLCAYGGSFRLSYPPLSIVFPYRIVGRGLCLGTPSRFRLCVCAIKPEPKRLLRSTAEIVLIMAGLYCYSHETNFGFQHDQNWGSSHPDPLSLRHAGNQDRPATTLQITVGRCRWWGLHKFGVPIKMISL